MEQTLTHLHELLGHVRTETGKVIIGQPTVIDQALIVILTGQHALIDAPEDVVRRGERALRVRVRPRRGGRPR